MKSTRSRTPCASAHPRPVAPYVPERVRFVDHQVGAVVAAHVRDFPQRRHVAPNGVQPLHDDQAIALALRQALELLPQALRRIVAKADHLRRRLSCRVVDAGVAVAVDQNHVARAAQSADERQVRLVAGAENNRVTFAEPVGKLALELFVHGQGAIGGPRPGRARAVLAHSGCRRCNHLGVRREAEVVVRSEHQRPAAADHDLRRSDNAVDDRQTGNGGPRREAGAAPLDRPQFVEQVLVHYPQNLIPVINPRHSGVRARPVRRARSAPWWPPAAPCRSSSDRSCRSRRAQSHRRRARTSR